MYGTQTRGPGVGQHQKSLHNGTNYNSHTHQKWNGKQVQQVGQQSTQVKPATINIILNGKQEVYDAKRFGSLVANMTVQRFNRCKQKVEGVANGYKFPPSSFLLCKKNYDANIQKYSSVPQFRFLVGMSNDLVRLGALFLKRFDDSKHILSSTRQAIQFVETVKPEDSIVVKYASIVVIQSLIMGNKSRIAEIAQFLRGASF